MLEIGTITYSKTKNIKKIAHRLFILLGLLLISCTHQENPSHNLPHLKLSEGDIINLRIAYSDAEKVQGLSGLRPDFFSESEGMLFYYPQKGLRHFWMPDTYFDLDIFFLNQSFEVLYLERDVPHHPGHQEPPPIARTQNYEAYHVLEMKSSSRLAKKIRVGTKLKVFNLDSYLKKIK